MPQTRFLDLSVDADRIIANTLCSRCGDSHPFREVDGTAYRVWCFDEIDRPSYIEDDVVGASAEWLSTTEGCPDTFTLYYNKEKFQEYFANIQVVADLMVG